ncbi:hypothetical protein [Ureibacillus thermosphaericus]
MNFFITHRFGSSENKSALATSCFDEFFITHRLGGNHEEKYNIYN